MGLKIELPSAGFIGAAGTTTSVIDSSTTQLDTYTIYSANPGAAETFSVSLPTSDLDDGAVILIKNIGEGMVHLNTNVFDGLSQTVEITNNQPVRLIYHSVSVGWLIT